MDIQPTKICLSKLSELYLPFQRNIWVKCETPITREEITKAIDNNELQSPSESVDMYMEWWDTSPRETHIKRIAWLVKHFDPKYYISIDFGIPGLCDFTIEDGNHRLLAAYYLNLPYILCDCAGSVDIIESFTLNKIS